MNISKFMLIHSVECLKVMGRNADRKPVYGESVVLSRVWIDETIGQNEGSNGKTPSDNAMLYYDLENSEPKDFVFEKDMKVLFDGKEFTVRTIHPSHGLKGLEHYEVGLV